MIGVQRSQRVWPKAPSFYTKAGSVISGLRSPEALLQKFICEDQGGYEGQKERTPDSSPRAFPNRGHFQEAKLQSASFQESLGTGKEVTMRGGGGG